LICEYEEENKYGEYIIKKMLVFSNFFTNNNHHNAEAAFKALALALRQAVSIDPKRSGIPSSKGVL